ncbi:MAG: SDR family NAD(P)-dependent oxidoreductase [Methanohalobium sp.]|uniref:SDR family NAD(P)-dependent oxidoreductase n=1 Tax=Methanohalobium sp. TaxID=2837493 RepID=UPI00397CCD4D
MNFGEKTVLITGGSSGIGLELAKLFAYDGYQLVLIAKPLEELENAKKILHEINPKIHILLKTHDLTQLEAAQEIYEFTQNYGLKINVLVNCAGFGSYGFVNEIDMDKELSMLQLHVSTLYHLTRLYLRDMVEHDDGYIINMSSMTAFQPTPKMAVYGASKSFVLQFSRALNYELHELNSKVRVMAVCPTSVKDTKFQEEADMENTKTFNFWMTTTADVVACDTYRAMQQGHDMVVPGRGFGLLQTLISRLPTNWLMKISRIHLQEKEIKKKVR